MDLASRSRTCQTVGLVGGVTINAGGDCSARLSAARTGANNSIADKASKAIDACGHHLR